MKLLIADDNPVMRSILKRLCVEHFTEINECEDGDDAIKTYKEFKPDWVLMDIKMKKMDGLKAMREIKTNHPEAKIIIVSQFNDKRIIEASIRSGAIEFVNKDNLERIEEIFKT